MICKVKWEHWTCTHEGCDSCDTGCIRCKFENDISCNKEKIYFGEIIGCEVEKDNWGYLRATIHINKRKKIELFQVRRDYQYCRVGTDEIEYFEIDGKDMLNNESNYKQ